LATRHAHCRRDADPMLALFDPRFIKHDLLVGKYKITLGDQYDGVLKGSR
jgi:hypothetical protein